MSHNGPPVLTFSLIEDVMSLPEPHRNEIIATSDVHRIGPLVEYTFHDYDNYEKQVVPLSACEEVISLLRTLQLDNLSSDNYRTSLRPRQVEFVRCPQSDRDFEDLRWVAFCKRAENAGTAAGLSRTFVQGLLGTAWEMASNVVEHSDAPWSSVIGYKWKRNEFEYVVADSGVGVLESLRTNNHYQYLLDSGQALDIALRDGESRHGRNIGRGFGFRDLLYNIASRNSFLRFRSGDHSVVIDGSGLHLRKVTRQCTAIRGFLITCVSFPSNLNSQNFPRPS